MSEQSTKADLVERTRLVFEAFSAGELDTGMSLYAPDAVYESVGLGTSFVGLPAIRGFFEDWTGSYEEFEMKPEEILDVGGGITLAVVLQSGRLAGGPGRIEWRFASIGVWVDGLIVRAINYQDVNAGRAAAERLADERR